MRLEIKFRCRHWDKPENFKLIAEITAGVLAQWSEKYASDWDTAKDIFMTEPVIYEEQMEILGSRRLSLSEKKQHLFTGFIRDGVVAVYLDSAVCTSFFCHFDKEKYPNACKSKCFEHLITDSKAGDLMLSLYGKLVSLNPRDRSGGILDVFAKDAEAKILYEESLGIRKKNTEAPVVSELGNEALAFLARASSNYF